MIISVCMGEHMNARFRLLTMTGVCVFAVGLAGSGAAVAAPGMAVSVAAHDTAAVAAKHRTAVSAAHAESVMAKRGSAATAAKPRSGVAAFKGVWEHRPDEPHSTTIFSFDRNGNISSEETMVSRAWKGTITPAGPGSYAVALVSQDADAVHWDFTLAATEDSDTWIAFNSAGVRDGALVRIS